MQTKRLETGGRGDLAGRKQLATRDDVMDASKAIYAEATALTKRLVDSRFGDLDAAQSLRFAKMLEARVAESLAGEFDKRLASYDAQHAARLGELERDHETKSLALGRKAMELEDAHAARSATLDADYQAKSLELDRKAAGLDGLLAKRLDELEAVYERKALATEAAHGERLAAVEKAYRDRQAAAERDYDARTALLQSFQEAALEQVKVLLANLQLPAPVVNFNPPEFSPQMNFNVPEQAAPVINVTLPEVAPLIEVKVPEQTAPVVNVATAPIRFVEKTFEYDQSGRPTRVLEREIKE